MKVKFPKRMSKATAIDLSIKHWQRMIKWAEKQPRTGFADIEFMYKDLDEGRYSSDCALCKKYAADVFSHCGKCPIYSKYGECVQGGIDHPYRKVVYSETWRTWIENAKKIVKALKGLK